MNEPRKTKGATSPVDYYRKTEVITSNRETLLLMMYGAAIRNLKRAIKAVNAGRSVERAELISKTQAIVSELRATLNFEVGKEIAENLEKLYDYVTHKLLDGNLNNSADCFEDALKVLETLNAAWEEAISSLKTPSSK